MRLTVGYYPERFFASLLIFCCLAVIPEAVARTAEELTIGEKIEAARATLSADPGKTDNLIALAGLLARRRGSSDCSWIAKLYLDALVIHPDDPELYSQFAGFIQKCPGQREFAVELAGKALQLSPEDPRALMVIAEQTRGSEAIEILERVVELDPENARAYLLLGDLIHRTGDYLAAKAYLKQAVELAPEEDESLRREIDRSLRETDKIAQLEEGLAAGTLNWDEYNYLARYFASGNSEENFNRAIEILHTASGEIEQPWLVHQALGWLHKQHQQFDQATAEYQEAIRLARKDIDTAGEYQICRSNQELGEIYQAMGKPDEALAAYNKAFSRGSQNQRLFQKIGDLYFLLGNYELAEAAYRQSGDTIGRARVYRKLDRHQQALSVLWAEIRKEPEQTPGAGIALDRYGKPAKGIWYKADYKLYLELGKTYREMGQPGKAQAAYWESLKIYPSQEASSEIEDIFEESFQIKP